MHPKYKIFYHINRIALYYRAIQRNLSGLEKAVVELFLREYQRVLELLPVFLESSEMLLRREVRKINTNFLKNWLWKQPRFVIGLIGFQQHYPLYLWNKDALPIFREDKKTQNNLLLNPVSIIHRKKRLFMPESSACFAGTKREQWRVERVREKSEGGGTDTGKGWKNYKTGEKGWKRQTMWGPAPLTPKTL